MNQNGLTMNYKQKKIINTIINYKIEADWLIQFLVTASFLHTTHINSLFNYKITCVILVSKWPIVGDGLLRLFGF